MKISCMKLKDDNKNFKLFKILGAEVYEINEVEETDKKLQELVNLNYNTIFITNELATFSENIITKYNKSKNIKIIIK